MIDHMLWAMSPDQTGRLSASARLVLANLAFFATPERIASPPVAALVSRSGCSRSTVFAALADLEERGLITRRGVDAGTGSTIWAVNMGAAR